MPQAAERRQISVLFCDLVGSTELSDRLDPEDVRGFMLAFLKACTDQIERWGGFVARFTGDGVLAYFGYPTVAEDDCERALAAALAVRVSVAEIPFRNGYAPAVRIGVATGMTVVGDLLGAGSVAQERLVVGVAPNLAARLQARAKPGQILAAEHTRRLTSGVFAFRSMGKRRLKGFDEPQALFELVGPRSATLRFAARQRPGPLAGREDEIRRLIDGWNRCREGHGALVGIVGAAGIGKSRLLHELRERAAATAHIWLEAGGAPTFRNTPFHAVTQLLEGLRAGVRTPRRSRAQAATDLGPLIIGEAELAMETLAAMSEATFTGARRQLIERLADSLRRLADRVPIVVAVEDLHWLDPSSLEFIEALSAAPSRLLIICTSRESAPTAWFRERATAIIALRPLDPSAIRRIVDATATGLEGATVRLLVTRADGVPLFAEELARLVAERTTASDDREIPSSLSDLLLSRLDGPAEPRRLAQIASVLGAEFHADLLGAVAETEMAGWREALKELLARLILSPRRDGLYGFRHALIRDAAYRGLLRAEQAELHLRVATTMAERFPAHVRANPELLAQHLEAGGESDQAQSIWGKAGELAGARQAYEEAQHAYERALSLLAQTAESAARIERELQLQSALARVLQITKGYSAVSTMTTTARAHHLAEQVGDLEGRLHNLLTTWVGTSSAGDYESAQRLADRMSLLAEAAKGEWRGAAYMAQVTTRYRTGDLVGAEAAFVEGQASFRHPAFDALPGAFAQTYGNAAIIAWLLGSEARSRERIDQVLSHSGDELQPYEVAFGGFMVATGLLLLGAPAAALPLAERTISLSENRFPQFAATARLVLGRAMASLGDLAGGVSTLAEGISLISGTQGRAGLTMYLTWLAETQLELGADESASITLNQALAANPWERFYRPETLRLRSELLSRRGDAAAAAKARADAQAAAQAMNAKAWLRRWQLATTPAD